jgi:hypothetical protein
MGDALMPYAWSGICYRDADKALSAFALEVPSSDPTGLNAFASAPVVSAGGLITWSIVNRNFATGNAVTVTGTTQLLPCDLPTADQWSLQSWIVPIAMFFALCTGFKSGYRP